MLQLSRAGLILTACIYLASFLILVAMGIQESISIAILVTDPASIFSFPFYAGIVSNFGVIIWTATATICLFAGSFVRDAHNRQFLLLSGILTLILMLDDQFLLHEEVFPLYLHIPGIVLYGFYAISLLIIAMLHFRLVLANNPILMALPLAFFAISVVSAPVTQNVLTTINPLLIEDGCKFIGISGWFLYFLLFASKAIDEQFNPKPS